MIAKKPLGRPKFRVPLVVGDLYKLAPTTAPVTSYARIPAHTLLEVIQTEEFFFEGSNRSAWGLRLSDLGIVWVDRHGITYASRVGELVHLVKV